MYFVFLNFLVVLVVLVQIVLMEKSEAFLVWDPGPEEKFVFGFHVPIITGLKPSGRSVKSSQCVIRPQHTLWAPFVCY